MRTQSYTSQVSEVPVASVPTPPAHPHPERRRASSKVSAGGSIGRKIRRKGQLSHLSTKDLGRWKPTDDLALILGVQQVRIYNLSLFIKKLLPLQIVYLLKLLLCHECLKKNCIGI